MFKCNGIEETTCNNCESPKSCYAIEFVGQADELRLCLKCLDKQAMMRHRAKYGKKPGTPPPAPVPVPQPVKPT